MFAPSFTYNDTKNTRNQSKAPEKGMNVDQYLYKIFHHLNYFIQKYAQTFNKKINYFRVVDFHRRTVKSESTNKKRNLKSKRNH